MGTMRCCSPLLSLSALGRVQQEWSFRLSGGFFSPANNSRDMHLHESSVIRRFWQLFYGILFCFVVCESGFIPPLWSFWLVAFSHRNLELMSLPGTCGGSALPTIWTTCLDCHPVIFSKPPVKEGFFLSRISSLPVWVVTRAKFMIVACRRVGFGEGSVSGGGGWCFFVVRAFHSFSASRPFFWFPAPPFSSLHGMEPPSLVLGTRPLLPFPHTIARHALPPTGGLL